MFDPEILLLNVQSLKSQAINLLEIDINYYDNINFLCLTETHSRADDIKLKHIDGFSLSSFFSRNLYEKGGVAIYSRSNLNVKRIDLDHFCVEKHFEICGISWKISATNLTTIILTCYRSPSGDINIYYDNIFNVLELLYKPDINIVLCGDFNIDSSLTSRSINNFNKLCNILRSFNLHPVVGWPTRVTKNTSTIIDHIFSNVVDTSLACVVDNDISDHRAILFELYSKPKCSTTQTFQFRRHFSDNSITNFCSDLLNESWAEIYNMYTIDESYQYFYDTFMFYFNKYFPLKKNYTKSNGTDKKWVNNEVKMSSIKLKDLHNLKNVYPIQ